MILRETPEFKAERTGRFLRVALKGPHDVLSTCPVNGGWRSDLLWLINHQSCEGREHNRHVELIHEIGEQAYHERICGELALPPERAALLSTAANMQYAACASESDADLAATAWITAGVKGNAVRAGDEAHWRENVGGQVVPIVGESNPPPGTIHILLLINQPLSPSALTRTATSMMEAKSAVLQELAVPSLYGSGLATGTGTDGFALAAARNGSTPRRFAGSHSKLGEISARAVMAALREALRWQNGLDPSAVRNLFHALSRFGVREDTLLEKMRAALDVETFLLFQANRAAVWHEPQVAAAGFALAAVLDRVAYGTLPAGSKQEAIAHQLALLACALAHDAAPFADFRAALAEEGGTDWSRRLAGAMALGWKAKWKLR